MSEDAAPYLSARSILVVNVNQLKDIEEVLDYLEGQPMHSKVVLVSKNQDELLQLFESFFVVIEAAGGIVWNDQNELLLIYRRNKWDLPKGKIEVEESIVDAGLREVKEECGIKVLKVQELFSVSYHTYRLDGNRIMKKTYWYEMFCGDKENISPQTEEGITQIKWVNEEELVSVIDETYPNLKEILEDALSKMRMTANN